MKASLQLSDKQKAAVASVAQWKLARRTYNAVTLSVHQLTGIERHKIYSGISDAHELAMLNTASAAMYCGASVYQVCAIFVAAWRRNDRRIIDVPPLSWFCSVTTTKHLEQEAKRQKFSIGREQSREAALSLVKSTVVVERGLFTLPSVPYRRTQRELDKYMADRVTAKGLCNAIDKRARKKRIGFLCR